MIDTRKPAAPVHPTGANTMRHPLDGNAIAADAHYDQPDEIGHEDGDMCGEIAE